MQRAKQDVGNKVIDSVVYLFGLDERQPKAASIYSLLGKNYSPS
jgi:hypothetical protein